MDKPSQLDFLSQSEINRNDGIKRASLNAEFNKSGWNADALNVLKAFVENRADSFMVEDVRAFAKSQGLSDPPTNRAWGSVILLAAKNKIVRFIAYSKTKDPLGHGRPGAVWSKF